MWNLKGTVRIVDKYNNDNAHLDGKTVTVLGGGSMFSHVGSNGGLYCLYEENGKKRISCFAFRDIVID